MTFKEQIEEVISANGWDSQLVVERLPATAPGAPESVRVRMRIPHVAEPSGMVGDYVEGVHPLEQVQQECLRCLRTGHPGI
ncbi:MAG TPA: hypothetical protein VM598_02335 [Bdellovibrionota bacterium]|nr:hypothetical protein [Bdellovibrionota bacterium]